MVLFLKIVAGCILAIVLFAGFLFIVLRKHIKRMLEACADDSTTPLKIHLNEDLNPDWLERDNIQLRISEFENLGFTTGKSYLVQEMQDVRMLSLFHEKFTGVIYTHPVAGDFFDIMHGTVDRQFLTVTTAPMGEELEYPPSMEKLYLTDTGIAEAFDIIDERCKHLDSVALSDENFREMCEHYYKEEQSYRNRHGGISYSEFQKIAEKGDSTNTEQQLREAYIGLKTDELEQWAEAGFEEYVEVNNIPENDARRYASLIIVPKKTDAEAFVHYLSYVDLVHEDHVEKIGASVRNETDIESLFDRINQARSPELRAKPCGTIDFPVQATVYEIAV